MRWPAALHCAQPPPRHRAPAPPVVVHSKAECEDDEQCVGGWISICALMDPALEMVQVLAQCAGLRKALHKAASPKHVHLDMDSWWQGCCAVRWPCPHPKLDPHPPASHLLLGAQVVAGKHLHAWPCLQHTGCADEDGAEGLRPARMGHRSPGCCWSDGLLPILACLRPGCWHPRWHVCTCNAASQWQASHQRKKDACVHA